MKIVEDKKYPNMYRVQWPNGDISVNTPHPEKEDGHYGFYNKTRAKEFLKRKGINKYDRGYTHGDPLGRSQEPTGALFTTHG